MSRHPGTSPHPDLAVRGYAPGAYGASIGLATISGPVLGGALNAANVLGTGWRSIFYLNLPIGVLALIGTALVRYVYRIPPLCDVPLEDVVGPVGRVIQGYLTGDAPG